MNDLFSLCRQSLWGTSDCFAAVIFTAANSTNVEYSISLDSKVSEGFDYGTDYRHSLLADRVLPLQWAMDSKIGNLPSSSKPSEQSWAGDFYARESGTSSEPPPTTGPDWLALVGLFIAPFFILIPIGASYHISVFVATERQSSMSELMQAQLVTDAPRIISTILSFVIIYFPGLLICSILLTQLLFTKTSDILLLFLTLLAGVSITVSSHFLASFFGKASLAGLYISTVVFTLALVTLVVSIISPSPLTGTTEGSSSNPQVTALSLIFPPYTWATLISDIANREYVLKPFSLSPAAPVSSEAAMMGAAPQETLKGYLYVIFFIVQIVVYGAATYVLERTLWGVKRTFEPLSGSSDLALSCTNLSKTYQGSRRWYWPFKTKVPPKLAVDGLDLEVKKGSVTFLLGPNGGGKTTTLKCIAGMTAMDSGSRLGINEEGTVFGICPQQNVSPICVVKDHH